MESIRCPHNRNILNVVFNRSEAARIYFYIEKTCGGKNSKKVDPTVRYLMSHFLTKFRLTEADRIDIQTQRERGRAIRPLPPDPRQYGRPARVEAVLRGDAAEDILRPFDADGTDGI
jgi:hypothetical protein